MAWNTGNACVTASRAWSRIGRCGGGSSMRTASNGEAPSSAQRRGWASSVRNRRPRRSFSSLPRMPPRRQEIPHEAERVGHDIDDVAAPARHACSRRRGACAGRSRSRSPRPPARHPAVRSASPTTAPSTAAAAGRSGRQNSRDQTPPASTTWSQAMRAAFGDHAGDGAALASRCRARRSWSGSRRPVRGPPRAIAGGGHAPAPPARRWRCTARRATRPTGPGSTRLVSSRVSSRVSSWSGLPTCSSQASRLRHLVPGAAQIGDAAAAEAGFRADQAVHLRP